MTTKQNQIPSHPQDTLPLTYPLPTIAFVTLKDRSWPHDPGLQLHSPM